MPSQKELNLNHSYITSILNYDPITGLLTRKISTSNRVKVGDEAGWDSNAKSNLKYRTVQIGKYNFMVHRLVWFMHTGHWPINQIDHINGIGTDNRMVNLRECTITQNMYNRRPQRNKSGHKGVFYIPSRNKYVAQITVNKKVLHLGHHNDIKDAIAARKAAEIIHHGAFAKP